MDINKTWYKRWWVITIIVFGGFYILSAFLSTTPDVSKIVSLDTFVKNIKAGQLKSVTVADKDHYILYTKDGVRYKVNYGSTYDITGFLLKHKINIIVDPQRQISWLHIIINLLPYIIFLIILLQHWRRMNDTLDKIARIVEQK